MVNAFSERRRLSSSACRRKIRVRFFNLDAFCLQLVDASLLHGVGAVLLGIVKPLPVTDVYKILLIRNDDPRNGKMKQTDRVPESKKFMILPKNFIHRILFSSLLIRPLAKLK
jgi:hypothetical protein